MIHAEQNVFLVLDVLNLFESDHVGNGQDLERPVFPRALFTTQDNPTEGTRSCPINLFSFSFLKKKKKIVQLGQAVF